MGSPDIGGSRASMALMAAETLGIDYQQIRSIVADTSSVGYTHVTGGSRVTFATGMAIVEASKKIVDELRARAAMIWDVQEGADRRPDHRGGLGQCRRHGARFLDPVLRCRGRPRDRQGDDPALCRGPRCRLRGPPLYVEGQIQGGVAQGIGWALNEEYIYDKNGRLDNAGFLDYRVPVSSTCR
jgi:CO/xanthine dehydrogenase Mo-binding subunit